MFKNYPLNRLILDTQRYRQWIWTLTKKNMHQTLKENAICGMIPYVWVYIYIYHHCFRGRCDIPSLKRSEILQDHLDVGGGHGLTSKYFASHRLSDSELNLLILLAKTRRVIPLPYLTLVICMLKKVQRGLNRSEQLKNKMFPPTT